jgi:hypothetical protein
VSAIAYRYASASDIDRYYGARPKATMRAIVITLDDEPAGIIGLARMNDHNCMFSEHKPELAPHLRRMPVLRAIKESFRMVSQSRLPVAAVADNPVLLTRLGFRPLQDDPEVFLWQC